MEQLIALAEGMTILLFCDLEGIEGLMGTGFVPNIPFLFRFQCDTAHL